MRLTAMFNRVGSQVTSNVVASNSTPSRTFGCIPFSGTFSNGKVKNSNQLSGTITATAGDGTGMDTAAYVIHDLVPRPRGTPFFTTSLAATLNGTGDLGMDRSFTGYAGEKDRSRLWVLTMRALTQFQLISTPLNSAAKYGEE